MKQRMFNLCLILVGLTLWFPASAASSDASIPVPSLEKILDTSGLLSHGYKGQGVRIGVISGGASNYSALMRNGILPKDVAFFGSMPGQGDEGDWMMQIVHDVAPDAKLAFCPAYPFKAVTTCAKTLVEQFHADIVVDDINPMPVSWGPTNKDAYFGALKREYPHVLFFTGAGNNGGGFYQGKWTPISLTVADRHYYAQDFGRSVNEGSHPYNSMPIPPGRGIHIAFGSNQQPSTGKDGCSPDNSKITLALLDEDNHLLASKSSRCPQFSLSYSNTTSSLQIVRVAILMEDENQHGLAFKMAVLADEESITAIKLRYATNGSAGNSATSSGLSSVAAVDPYTQQNGQFSAESFANSGPQCQDYALSDHSHRLVHLQKNICINQPRFVTPDRIMVAFPAQNDTGYTMKPFTGSSSAGPAAAGVAALLLSAHVPVQNIESLLEKTAHPQTTASGWNERYGYGLIDADSAAVAAGVLSADSSVQRNQPEDAASGRFHPAPRFQYFKRLSFQASRGNNESLTDLESAASNGNADAQAWLAVYDNATGNDRDAVRWCWTAAQHGEPIAEHLLGMLFLKGEGVPRDAEAAHSWFLRAAQRGMLKAYHDLAILEYKERQFVKGYALMLAAQERHNAMNQDGGLGLDKFASHLNDDDIRLARRLAERYRANPATIE